VSTRTSWKTRVRQQCLYVIGVAEVVARVNDLADMPFGNVVEREGDWELLERSPGCDRHATAWRKDSMHLARGSSLVRKELQALMTRQYRKPLTL
jgi:hypothetical protein